LKSLLDNLPKYKSTSDSVNYSFEKSDSLYRFISARVINNSVNKQYNYITLNKGKRDGIKVDQGIVNSDGVVGVITNVSESFSMGFSVLNKRWGVSAKLKKSGTFGPISWDGTDFRFANLTGIPFHVELAVGDTILTSSFSSVFPEGVFIGTIEEFAIPSGENYYNIKVKLGANFKALTFVEVIDNLKKEEIIELEKMRIDDPLSN
jgi:rod shape-determining protein MreC